MVLPLLLLFPLPAALLSHICRLLFVVWVLDETWLPWITHAGQSQVAPLSPCSTPAHPTQAGYATAPAVSEVSLLMDPVLPSHPPWWKVSSLRAGPPVWQMLSARNQAANKWIDEGVHALRKCHEAFIIILKTKINDIFIKVRVWVCLCARARAGHRVFSGSE